MIFQGIVPLCPMFMSISHKYLFLHDIQLSIISWNLQPLFHGAFRTYFSKITHFFL